MLCHSVCMVLVCVVLLHVDASGPWAGRCGGAVTAPVASEQHHGRVGSFVRYL